MVELHFLLIKLDVPVGPNFTNRNTMIDKPPHHQDSKEACAQVQLIRVHVKQFDEGGSSLILRIHLLVSVIYISFCIHKLTNLIIIKIEYWACSKLLCTLKLTTYFNKNNFSYWYSKQYWLSDSDKKMEP